jgi:hypothetical protein
MKRPRAVIAFVVMLVLAIVLWDRLADFGGEIYGLFA